MIIVSYDDRLNYLSSDWYISISIYLFYL